MSPNPTAIFLLLCCVLRHGCEPVIATTTSDLESVTVVADNITNNHNHHDNAKDGGNENNVIEVEKSVLTDLMTNDIGDVYHDDLELELTDEEKDAKILVDVIASIAEWKDRQQRKLLHYLFHREKRDEEVVCYGDLGCFRDEGPFNYLDMLPSPPEEIGTVFYLYTRRNDETPQLLDYLNTSSISTSNFNVSLPSKIIIHGFGSSCKKIWPREMRLSFLLVEDCNVVCVDWEAGAVDPNYVRAAVNTRLVGKQVAALINKISAETGVTINNNTHLVGFSLGAHVSGFVGKELKNLSRITGLDPAGPLFEGYTPNVRLDKTDADFVDVIHSNGDSLIIGGLGAWEPIGHVDFYPNGGKAQRGCQNLLIGGLYDFIYSYSTKNESYRYLCNHRRAYKLFTDSISPKCKFTAFPCESYEKFESGQCFSCGGEAGECGQLGYRSNMSPARGSLYLLTREEEPFCAAQFKINIMFTGSRLPIYTYGALQIKLINKEGINETFTLTSTHDELLTSGAKIEKLIVSHPVLSEPTEIQILYIAYEGWIYSGRDVWSIEKLVLSDGYGKSRSWCKEFGELLPNGVPVNIPLQLGECLDTTSLSSSGEKVNSQPPPVLPSHSLQPPGGQVPVKTNNVRPPLISNDISKHGDILDTVIPVSETGSQFNLNTIPRPVLLPVKPQLTVLPGTPDHHYQWGQNKPVFNPRPPLQPYHLQGPPGSWNIVTSKPGSLPPPIHVYQSKLPHSSEGVEIQLGPRLPLPPINANVKPAHQFPPRRRPSTPTKEIVIDLTDMSTASSNTSLLFTSSTEQLLPATERVDRIPETDVIVIETNSIQTNQSLQNKTGTGSNGGQEAPKTDILSDDKLTIFKVGPDNDIVRVSNETGHNDTDVNSNEDYKYVILHKLPNGNAVNLENLKTYNYEDLMKGHSSVVEDSNQEEKFDRENLEFFDVPRRVSNDRPDPYIIYQLADTDKQKQQAADSTVYTRPNVHPVYKHPVSSTSNSQSVTTKAGKTNSSSLVKDTSDWIPKNRTDNDELSIEKLSELSQLAQVSITDKGSLPLALPSSPSLSLAPKLNVQLLPPRLSAVLSHLTSSSRERTQASKDKERHERQHGGGAGGARQSPPVSPYRKNKVSPAFQPPSQPAGFKGRDRHYARRIHGSDYVVTKPYQTQVIPSSINHKYIPLLHNQKKPLWWHPNPSNPGQYEFPIRPHQVLTHPHHYRHRMSHQVVTHNNPVKSHNASITEKNNLAVSLDNTHPPMVFSEKQSLLIGIKQKAVGVTKNPKPINIFPPFHQSDVKANVSESVMNKTDSNLEISSITHHSSPTDDDKSVPMQNSNISPTYLSTNLTTEDTNQMMNGTEVYLDYLEPQSGENMMRTTEQPIIISNTTNYTASVNDTTSVSKNELSENNESSSSSTLLHQD